MPNRKAPVQSVKGFTLAELMIVVVIVSVLMAIALPAYRDQVIRSHRATAKSELLEIANRQEQFLLANRAYAGALSDLSYAAPTDVTLRYTFSISSISNAPPYYELTATAINAQAGDGNLTIDSEGVQAPEAKWAR